MNYNNCSNCRMVAGILVGLVGVFVVGPGTVFGLDNGMARTPPMGWLAWERFRCNTDCKEDPEFCISERLFRWMGDMMVVGDYLSAGYEYLILDDCWLDHSRAANGTLIPDPERFPSGIPALADYIHKLGLKFGIYEDYGNFTCGGYPGILGYLEQDARTFADWGVDYVKLDGCYSEPDTMDAGYPEFGGHLNSTGRSMVYSCSWPAYQMDRQPDYQSIANHCNLWRNFDDIADSWESVLSIIDYYGDDTHSFQQHAGPGHWNDPDMLIIGNFGLSLDQAKAQMGIWAMLAAPLIMSADLRTIRPEFKDILLNREVIKIDQDPLGIQATRVARIKDIDVFTRPIMPLYKSKTSVAVAFLNRWTEGTPLKVKFELHGLGLDHSDGYDVTEVFTGKNMGIFKPWDTFHGEVNPTGILLLRFNILPPNRIEKEKSVDEEDVENNKVKVVTPRSPPVQVKYPGLSGWKTEL